MEIKELTSVDELSKIIGVSAKTIYNWIDKEDLPHILFLGVKCFTKSQVAEIKKKKLKVQK